jgi:parvulin-like peptidyl-prolyl isomerase
MRSFFLLIILLASATVASAQDAAQLFAKVKNTRQAQKLIADNPSLRIRILSFSDERDTAMSFKPFFRLKPGETFLQDSIYYKLLSQETYPALRCSYIYLDGDSLSPSAIDNKRKEIITAYRAGSSFAGLVHIYNMDSNPNGDTGWFGPDIMVRDFEDAVRDHKKGDLFILELPDKRWYYVVLKTHENRMIKKVTLLMAGGK